MHKTKSILAVLTLSFFIISSTQLGMDMMQTKAYAKVKASTHTVKTASKKVTPKKSTKKTVAASKAAAKKVKVGTAKTASAAKKTASKTTAKKTSTAKKASTAKKTTAKKAAAKKTTAPKKTTKVASSKKSSYSSGRKITPSRGGRISYSSEKAGQIIDYAKNFLGVKYVFGGASPSGFDCSGFTMYVYRSIGISLPHTATGQSKMGTPVGRDELKPGDLVFFETYKKGISHVGIYVGNGSFIEASSSRGIAITSLSSSYYAPRYMGAVRILQ